MNYQVGELLQLKKQHPCGSNTWKVLRTGADLRLACEGCGHQIMLSKRNLDRALSPAKKAPSAPAIAEDKN